MQGIISRLPVRGEFAKNALTLTLGTSLSQVLPLIFYPILSRLFEPEAFGLLATISSISMVLAVVSTGKYERSILLGKNKLESANSVGLTLFLSSFFLIISLVILQIGSTRISIALNQPMLNTWVLLCPFIAFSIVVYNSYNEWCVRNKSFKTLSINKIINSGSNVFSKLSFGLMKVAGFGLVLGELLGRSITATICIYKAVNSDKAEFTKISISGMLETAKKYIDFPKFHLPSELLMTLGFTLPVYLIGFLYNSVEVGYYAMTMNVLSLPISVISRAVMDVFRQKANEEFISKGSFDKLYRSLFIRLLLLGLFGTSILFFIVPSLFSIILGNEWRIAGEYSQILVPMIFLNFLSTSFGGVFIIVGKLKAELIWRIYYVAITIASFVLGNLIFENIKMSLVFFSIGRGSSFIIYLFLTYKFSFGNARP